MESVAFSPDSKQVLTGGRDNAAHLWDAQSGKELRAFTGHSNTVCSVAFSPDGKHVLTGSEDSTTRIWDAQTGRELCRLISFTDGAWAVVDAEGRFDAANGGDVEGLHWVVGNEPIALKQLKERYYDPGLLAKYMGFNKEPLRQVAAFTDVKLFPVAEFDAPAGKSTQLTLNLTNRGGGIGKVQVFVNGKELLADARGPKPDSDAQQATLTVDLAGAPVLPGQPNQITVVTWNAEGYLSSRGLVRQWTPEGQADAHPPELYLIVCGVSQYAEPKLNLRFSAKDAEDMAHALELAGKRLFGADKVHLTLLSTADDPKAQKPTKDNLRQAFEAARQARPGDVLVVYLAGHGVALKQGGDEYCYLTADARGTDATALADPAVLASWAVTSSELVDWIKQIPALKQVMLLDTCAAGAAAAKLMENRDLSGDQVRALDRLKDRTGFHVLMGCAADRVSYEASQYSQGLLTYSLLEGMAGAAAGRGVRGRERAVRVRGGRGAAVGAGHRRGAEAAGAGAARRGQLRHRPSGGGRPPGPAAGPAQAADLAAPAEQRRGRRRQPETGEPGRQASGRRQFQHAARRRGHDGVRRCRRAGRGGAAGGHLHHRRRQGQRPPGAETGRSNTEQGND